MGSRDELVAIKGRLRMNVESFAIVALGSLERGSNRVDTDFVSRSVIPMVIRAVAFIRAELPMRFECLKLPNFTAWLI